MKLKIQMDREDKIRKYAILVILFSGLFYGNLHAQSCTQKWVDQTVKSSTGKYNYIVGTGKTLKQAVIDAVISGAVTSGTGGASATEIRDKFENNDGIVSTQQGINSSLQINGRNLQYSMIDYCQSYGSYKALVMLRKELSDRVIKFPKYNRHLPVSFLLSAVIPGTGQMYKKQISKGALFLGSAVVFGGGAYFFESQRAAASLDFDQASSFQEREDLITEIENNQNYRNLSLALVGVAYLTNLIDVFAAKSDRYVYNRNKKIDWNFAYIPNSQGGTSFASMKINLSR